MIRRPWLGLALSLTLHAVALAAVPVLTSRDDRLPELILDLREPFVPGPAPVASPPREQRPARPSPEAESPLKVAPAPPEPTPPAPAPPVAHVIETPPPPPSPPMTAVPPAPAPPATSPPRDGVGSNPPSSFTVAAAPAPVTRAPSGGTVTSGATTATATGDRPGSNVAPAMPDRGTSGRGEAIGPSGPRVASVPPAATGSGVGAEYGLYLAALRQRIQESVSYPASARRRGLMGTVSVEILILVNGAIGEVKLLESSAHSVLDDAALDTIRSLPRVPLPPELPARPLRVRVPVVFEMR